MTDVALEEPAHLTADRLAALHQLSDTPRTPLERIQAATHSTEALKALPPARPLVAELLDLDSLAVIFGPSGEGKSFLAIDLALHVATGSWWNGHEVSPGPVVYVAAEGARGLAKRIDAWQAHHHVYDLSSHHPIWWVTRPINLHDPGWSGAFAEYCAAKAPVLVVLDTLARCMAGADENASKDMGRVVDSADAVKRRTGATVVAVHHSGKDLTSGARGSSALRAAVDSELEVTASDDRMTVKVSKQKDGPRANPLRLIRTPVADSCVLVVDRGQTDPDGALTASGQIVLEALARIDVPGGITAGTWQKAAQGVSERTFYEQRKQLLKRELVTNVGTDGRPRYRTTAREEDDA